MSWELLPYETVGEWPDLHWKVTPNVPAVYVIYSWLQPVYVGQTINLRHRLTQHRYRDVMQPPSLARVRIKYKPTHDLWRTEYKLIQRLQPPLNKVHYLPKIKVKKISIPYIPKYRRHVELEYRPGLAAFDYINFDSSL